MKNPFTVIVAGLKWVGKELDLVPHQIQKVVAVTKDVEQDAATLCPELVTLIDKTGNLVTAAAKDGGQVLASLESVVAAITAAATSDGLDFTKDAAVLASVEAFAKQVAASSTYVDVLEALKEVVTSYDDFGAGAKAALKKLETDVTA